MRNCSFKKVIVLFSIIGMICCFFNQTAFAQLPYERPSYEDMALDGIIGRPLMLASAILGTGIFIVTSPFSALGGNDREAANTLIAMPLRDTFGRCLGCEPIETQMRY